MQILLNGRTPTMEVNISPKVRCRTRRTRGRSDERGPDLSEAFDMRELPAVLAFKAAEARWRKRLATGRCRSGLQGELSLFRDMERKDWRIVVPDCTCCGAILHAPASLTGPDYSLAIVVDPGFLNP